MLDACKGMRALFMGRGAKLVPLREMVDVMSVARKDRVSLKPGSWVRVKNGTYKGDLAQVVDVDMQAFQLTIKLVPRIDYAALQAKAEGKEVKRARVRPVAKAFSLAACREMGLVVERRRDQFRNECATPPCLCLRPCLRLCCAGPRLQGGRGGGRLDQAGG